MYLYLLLFYIYSIYTYIYIQSFIFILIQLELLTFISYHSQFWPLVVRLSKITKTGTIIWLLHLLKQVKEKQGSRDVSSELLQQAAP